MFKRALFTCSAFSSLLLMGCSQGQALSGASSSSGGSSTSSSSSNSTSTSTSSSSSGDITIATKLFEPGGLAPASTHATLIGNTEFFVNSGAAGEVFRPLWAHIPSDAMVSFGLETSAGSPFVILPETGVISISPTVDLNEFIDQQLQLQINILPRDGESRVLASSASIVAHVVQSDVSPESIKIAVLYPPPGANTAADNDGRIEVVIKAQGESAGAVKAVQVNGSNAYKLSTDDDVWYTQIDLEENENTLDIQASTSSGIKQKTHSLLHDLIGLENWQAKDLTGLAWNGELWLQAQGLLRWQPLREGSSINLFEARGCYNVQGSWGQGFYTYGCFSAIHAQKGVPWIAVLETRATREDFNGRSSHDLIRFPVTIDTIFEDLAGGSSVPASGEPLYENIYSSNFTYQISYTGNHIYGDVRKPIAGYRAQDQWTTRLITKFASIDAEPVDQSIADLNAQFFRAAEHVPSLEFEISNDQIYFTHGNIVGIASTETLRVIKSFELPIDLALKANALALDTDSQTVYLQLTGNGKGGIYAMSLLNGDLVKLGGLGFDQINKGIPQQSSSGRPFWMSSSSSSSGSASSSSGFTASGI
jgi:hypothetical protein